MPGSSKTPEPKEETVGKTQAVAFETPAVPWYAHRSIQIAGLLAAAVLLAAGMYWLAANRTAQNTAHKPGAKSDGQGQKATAQPSSVDKAYARGDYQAAAKELESAAPTDYDKRRQLAYTYENAGEFKKALAVYEELEKAGQLKAAYTFRAAEAARLGGNTDRAVYFYKLAKERYNQEKGRAAKDRIERIDAALKELGES